MQIEPRKTRNTLKGRDLGNKPSSPAGEASRGSQGPVLSQPAAGGGGRHNWPAVLQEESHHRDTDGTEGSGSKRQNRPRSCSFLCGFMPLKSCYLEACFELPGSRVKPSKPNHCPFQNWGVLCSKDGHLILQKDSFNPVDTKGNWEKMLTCLLVLPMQATVWTPRAGEKVARLLPADRPKRVARPSANPHSWHQP